MKPSRVLATVLGWTVATIPVWGLLFVFPQEQAVVERRVPPVIRPDRPMLALWDNGCRIVIVESVGDEENARPDRVMVRWPAGDGDGNSWCHGWTVRDRLVPLEK